MTEQPALLGDKDTSLTHPLLSDRKGFQRTNQEHTHHVHA